MTTRDRGTGSPALPESSAQPPILPAASPGMWSDFYRSQAPFDADAGFPATPVQQDERAWPDPSLTGRDVTAIQPPPTLLGPPHLPPIETQGSPDVGRNFHRWQLPFDANVRIPAASAHDQLWPDAALGMRDQTRWGSLTLPRLTVTPTYATNPNSILRNSITDGTAIVSDADPETWIAGLRYANRTGRGPRGRGGRELTVPEQIEFGFTTVPIELCESWNRKIVSCSPSAVKIGFRGRRTSIVSMRRSQEFDASKAWWI